MTSRVHNWFCLYVIALLSLALLAAPPAQSVERVELYDATLQDFVEWSSQMLNKSVVVGSDVRNAPISIFASYADRDDLENLLKNAVVSAGFYFSAEGGVIRISSAPLPESPDLMTEVIQLQHLQSDFAYQAVRDVLTSRQDATSAQTSAQLMVSPSPTSNALIVTATLTQLEAVRRVVQEIDRPRRQVLITAVVAELADDDFEALGLNVGLDSNRTNVTGTSLRGSDRSDLGFSVTFAGPTLSAFLQAVKSTGRNRILSTPQLLTLNRESASIVVGQNVPFITGQTTSGSTPASDPFQTIVRQDVGVTLEVTPFITPADAIELQVMQSASTVSDDKTAADIITNTRKVMTRVQLQNGDGVVLGGLRSQQTDKSVSRVPLLSDVPLIGGLFRHTSTRTRSTNLVVLLTARIHGSADRVDPSVIQPLQVPALSAADEGFGAAGALVGGATRAR